MFFASWRSVGYTPPHDNLTGSGGHTVWVPGDEWTDRRRNRDGDELLPMCNSTVAYLNDHHSPMEKQFSEGYCLGLVTGVSETSDDVCSLGVPSGQLVTVVVKFLEDHPDRLNLKNTTLVRQALMRAWPCKKK
jgi:hypothetical protein